MYKLPDSPEKRALIAYLKEAMEESKKQQRKNEKKPEEPFYMGKQCAYRDIWDKIK